MFRWVKDIVGAILGHFSSSKYSGSTRDERERNSTCLSDRDIMEKGTKNWGSIFTGGNQFFRAQNLSVNT